MHQGGVPRPEPQTSVDKGYQLHGTGDSPGGEKCQRAPEGREPTSPACPWSTQCSTTEGRRSQTLGLSVPEMEADLRQKRTQAIKNSQRSHKSELPAFQHALFPSHLPSRTQVLKRSLGLNSRDRSLCQWVRGAAQGVARSSGTWVTVGPQELQVWITFRSTW